jgi:hypothetical protein
VRLDARVLQVAATGASTHSDDPKCFENMSAILTNLHIVIRCAFRDEAHGFDICCKIMQCLQTVMRYDKCRSLPQLARHQEWFDLIIRMSRTRHAFIQGILESGRECVADALSDSANDILEILQANREKH